MAPPPTNLILKFDAWCPWKVTTCFFKIFCICVVFSNVPPTRLLQGLKHHLLARFNRCFLCLCLCFLFSFSFRQWPPTPYLMLFQLIIYTWLTYTPSSFLWLLSFPCLQMKSCGKVQGPSVKCSSWFKWVLFTQNTVFEHNIINFLLIMIFRLIYFFKSGLQRKHCLPKQVQIGAREGVQRANAWKWDLHWGTCWMSREWSFPVWFAHSIPPHFQSISGISVKLLRLFSGFNYQFCWISSV